MELIEINKKKLDEFLVEQDHAVFLQSYEWGEFQKKVGFDVFRFGVEDKGNLIAVVSLIKKKIFGKFGYFYAPRGPILESGIRSLDFKIEIMNFLLTEIKKKAENENCIFLRFEPQDGIFKYPDISVYKTIDLQPAETLILDLNEPEEELMNGMHQKTRYNIRLAEKRGVEIVEAGENDFDNFWKLMEETYKRDGFKLHPKEYYRKMLSLREISYGEQVDENLKIKLFFAKYQGKILSANIVSFFGDTATYMHGASSNEFRNVMAPYLLQWETSRSAKKSGYKCYDLFGVDEKKWPGVTKYKEGFCAKNLGKCKVIYPGTYDAVFSELWYNGYKLMRFIRRRF